MKSFAPLVKVLLFAFLAICLLGFLWFFKVYDFKGEKVLIPEGYAGQIIIYYDRIKGENLRRDNSGTIIYRIPKAGKLAVNFKDYIHRGTPLQNREYFLYDSVTGKVLNKVKEYGQASKTDYFLLGFQYGPDSLNQTGKNYYSESFTLSK